MHHGLDVFDVVVHARDNRSCALAFRSVWEVELQVLLFCVVPEMAFGDSISESFRSRRGWLERGRSHPERLKEVLLEVLGEGFFAFLLHEIACNGVHGIAVDVLGADRSLD